MREREKTTGTRARDSARTRLTGVIMLLAAVVAGTSACSFFVDENEYRSSAGDGVNVEGLGDVAVRNVLVVANDDGTRGNLVAAVVNNSDQERSMTVSVGDPVQDTLRIDVAADSTVSYGARDSLDDPPLIDPLDADPGGTIPVTFETDVAEAVTVQVPVLGGCLEYLRQIEPNAEGPEECPWYVDVEP